MSEQSRIGRNAAERDAVVVRLAQRRSDYAARPAPGEPAITFSMDGDARITFRDQSALDEYVAGALREAADILADPDAIYTNPVIWLRQRADSMAPLPSEVTP